MRGKGIGACSELFAISEAFEVRQLNKLCCEVFTDNEAAWKLHERYGFKREGHLRQHILKDGMWRDVYVYGRTA
jgi:RimJ/RimL family protein N-acetyltransferase